MESRTDEDVTVISDSIGVGGGRTESAQPSVYECRVCNRCVGGAWRGLPGDIGERGVEERELLGRWGGGGAKSDESSRVENVDSDVRCARRPPTSTLVSGPGLCDRETHALRQSAQDRGSERANGEGHEVTTAVVVGARPSLDPLLFPPGPHSGARLPPH